MAPVPHLRFVLDPRAVAWPDLESLDESDIEREPRRFVGGSNSWIAQTFVRLRSAIEARGWRASARSDFIPGTISIVHRDDMNRFASDGHASYLVVVRADRAPWPPATSRSRRTRSSSRETSASFPCGRSPVSCRAIL